MSGEFLGGFYGNAKQTQEMILSVSGSYRVYDQLFINSCPSYRKCSGLKWHANTDVLYNMINLKQDFMFFGIF